MATVTWRAPDELVERVKAAAAQASVSLNEFMSVVLNAATDPETAASEGERIRERLARAGITTLTVSAEELSSRPSTATVEVAARRAASGVPLSSIVGEDR